MRSLFHFKSLALALGVAALLTAGSARCDEPLARDAADWLEASTNLDGKIADDVREMMLKKIGDHEDFVVTFGAGRTKSGRACEAHVFAGHFYVFELTDAQAAKKLEDLRDISVCSGKRHYEIDSPKLAVSELKIEDAGHIDPRKKFSGQISYRCNVNMPGKLVLRLSYRWGTNSTQSFHHLDAAPANDGTLTFTFPAMQGEKDEAVKAGPQVVFVDLCSMTEEPDAEFGNVKTPKVHVISNSAAVLLNIDPEATTESASAPAGLEGTKWKFDGAETTVEFLPGGQVKWNGEAKPTYVWTQNGDAITINVNNFTLFRLTHNGDTLSGTWERLQGDEVGQKNPSGLKRVAN